jgi:hypothetical protein
MDKKSQLYFWLLVAAVVIIVYLLFFRGYYHHHRMMEGYNKHTQYIRGDDMINQNPNIGYQQGEMMRRRMLNGQESMIRPSSMMGQGMNEEDYY